MAAWTAANLARLSSPKSASSAQAASLIHRRGLAGGGGYLSFPFLSLLHVWWLRKNSGGKKKKLKESNFSLKCMHDLMYHFICILGFCLVATFVCYKMFV